MALKFLNKKGWHTGSLRNIENVWKAEQKHDAEQKKLDELRKQIQEERERAEFRLLQERAGLVPRQERLDFLYESGLAVGKGSSEGFKALQAPPAKAETSAAGASESGASSKAAVPGALFEDKPQSANDAWRKLHSDPLLLIRQREQEALSRIKNNPVQMAMIRKSAEAEKQHKEKHDKKGKREKKEHKKNHDRSKSKREKHLSKDHSDSKEANEEMGGKRKRDQHDRHTSRTHSDLASDENEGRRKDRPTSDRHFQYKSKYDRHSTRAHSDSGDEGHGSDDRRKKGPAVSDHHSGLDRLYERKRNEIPSAHQGSVHSHHRRTSAPKLSEEERVARLREMQLNAELHEEQRWKRLKRASDTDAQEAVKDRASSGGSNFLDAAQKSIYGTEKGGSSTIEESVRRRSYYLQGGSAAEERNAFRR